MSYYEYPHPVQPAQQYANVSYQGAPAPGEAQYYNYAAQPNQPGAVQSWVNFQNSTYVKGFVVGAGLALVLANPTVQKALVSGAVKLWTSMQGGVEEIKERVQDIRAEMSTKE